MCPFLCQRHAVFSTVALQYTLKAVLGTLPEHLQDCPSCPCPVVFPFEVEIALLISVKLCWNFDGDLLNLYSVHFQCIDPIDP